MLSVQKYYRVKGDLTKNPPGLVFENKDALKAPDMPIFGISDFRKRGFRPFREVPRFRYIKNKGRMPGDLERIPDYWLITKATKTVFQDIDNDAFQFVSCEMLINDEIIKDEYFLCDVIRVLDALDEDKSNVIINNDDSRYYRISGSEDLYFLPKAIGSAHIFRMYRSWHTVICDDILRQACRKARLRGISFRPTIVGLRKLEEKIAKL